MACHLVSRARGREIRGCSAQQVELAVQQLQGALGGVCVKRFCGPFLAPGKEQRGRPEAQGAGEKEREGMTLSLKQRECAEVVHSRVDWDELLPSSCLPRRKS